MPVGREESFKWMTNSQKRKVVLLNLKKFLIILIDVLHYKKYHLLQLLDILKWWHQFPVRNIAKGTTDPPVDCFNKSFQFGLVALAQ